LLLGKSSCLIKLLEGRPGVPVKTIAQRNVNVGTAREMNANQ